MELLKNVGGADRALRILVGAALVIAAILGYGTPWTWLGLVPLLTGIFAICPLYYFFGINTRKDRVIAGGD